MNKKYVCVYGTNTKNERNLSCDTHFFTLQKTGEGLHMRSTYRNLLCLLVCVCVVMRLIVDQSVYGVIFVHFDQIRSHADLTIAFFSTSSSSKSPVTQTVKKNMPWNGP